MLADPRIAATVRQLVDWLVAGDYSAVEVFTGGRRISADEMQQAIQSYGRKLVSLPTWALEGIDIVEIVGSSPRAWSVRVDLWTVSEGRSDLTLECTMIECEGDFLKAEIDNIHVC